MLFVISPAKSLDFDSPSPTQLSSQAAFLDQSEQLIASLRTLSASELQKLMSISDALAALNEERNHAWKKEMTLPEAKQAVFAFQGDVYQGMDAASFTEEELQYAQSHLAILSGLYGVLKPLDLIRPYRLEMGTRLAVGTHSNLYQFWGEEPTQALNKSLEALPKQVLVNLASNEYFKVVKKKSLHAEVITPVFKEYKNGAYKVISFYAKKARGMMARFAVQQQLTDPEALKNFDSAGYAFNEELSGKQEWVFTRG